MNLLNRIKGGLFGLAVGDALGGTTEFMSQADIREQHGELTEIIGGGVWQLEAGEVTDDTMMTLCVAEGLLAHPAAPIPMIGERFLAWYHSRPKDIGNIIRHVLSTYKGNWFEAAMLADLDLGQSAGNGSLMRCLPVGLLYRDLPELERISRMQSKMTHYDERCDEACRIYNRIVYRLLKEESLREALALELAGTSYSDLLNGEPPHCEPTGYVVDSFRWVIHWLLSTSGFEEVVQRAANRGGDTDTIAAIAGGLAGVYYGFNAIPERYVEALLIKERVADVSERIHAKRIDVVR